MGNNNESKLSSSSSVKNVGTQTLARDLASSDVLERRPPLGLEENLVLEPIRDSLLADCGATQELTDGLSEQSLTTGDFDRLSQSKNVTLLHRRRLYTSELVKVKKSTCVTSHKEACTVLQMSLRKRKPVLTETKKRARPQVARGPDGKTVGERIKEAMADRGPDYRETDLFRDVNRVAGRGANDPPLVSQQLINQLRNDEIDGSRSSFTCLVAEGLHVRAVWLQFGFGAKTDDNDGLASSIMDLIRSHERPK